MTDAIADAADAKLLASLRDGTAFEVSVLVYPHVLKISELETAALQMATPAFDGVQSGWTCWYRNDRWPLYAVRIGDIAMTGKTTSGQNRQPYWGAEYRVGILKEGT